MANPFGIDFKELLANPAFKAQVDEYAKGYSKGEAIAQTVGEVPMQPQVTAEAIQPEPTFIQPETTTYTGLKDTATPDMPPAIKKEPSIYDQMQAATSQKDQQKLLYKLMSQSMQQQEAAAQSAKAALQKEQERQAGLGTLQKLDLRPFAQALRGYGSTSVGEGYAPEMTELQRQELMRKLQGQVEAATQGVTKEQVAALKTLEDQKNNQALLSQGNQDMRAYEAVQRKYDKPQQNMIEFYQSYDNFKSALDMGTTEAIQSATAAFARMSGEKGPLSDTDIQRVIPDNLKLRWAMYRQKILSGGSTPAPQEIIDALRKNLSNLENAAITKYKTQIDLVHNQTRKGPGSYKVHSDNFYDESMKIIRPEEAGAETNKVLSPEEWMKSRAK
jgi:hypothetical protein